MDEYESENPHYPDVLKIKSEDGTEEEHYSATYQGFPEECRLYAQRVLNETEENKAKGLRMLKDYVKRKGLPCPSDNTLLAVLRNKKYNLDKCELKLKKFLKNRRLIVDKLAQLDMDKITTIVDDLCFTVFPYRDRHGRLILHTRPNLNLNNYEMDEVGYCLLTALLFLFSSPMTSVYGICYIADCPTSMLLCYPITMTFRKMLPLMLDLTSSISRINVTNANLLTRWTLYVLRPFIPEKISKRISCHSGYDSLPEMYHPDILPEELGGKLGPLSNKHYREKLLKFIEHLRDER